MGKRGFLELDGHRPPRDALGQWGVLAGVRQGQTTGRRRSVILATTIQNEERQSGHEPHRSENTPVKLSAESVQATEVEAIASWRC